MWDRTFRCNPLTERYKENLEYRPILPADGSGHYLGLRKQSDPYKRIYYYFLLGNSKKILLNNNMRAEDRERFKQFHNYFKTLNKNLIAASIIPTSILYGLITSIRGKGHYKIDNLNILIVSFMTSFFGIKSCLNKLNGNIAAYYYLKYEDETVDQLNQIKDIRREYFRPDTSVPYRETHQEIYDKKTPSQLHDSSIYYGPHPYDDYENVEDVVEINKKFLQGESKFDQEGMEEILGDKVTIKRRIRDIPTVEEYRRI